MKDRRAWRMLGLAAALAALGALALCVGRYPSPGVTPVWEWLKDPLFRPILLEMRLPRIVLALLAGGVLAGAGFVLQMVYTAKQILAYWDAYLIHSQGTTHGGRNRQLQHFRNWLKLQPNEKSVRNHSRLREDPSTPGNYREPL